MADRGRPMDEYELAALIDSQIADAKSYDATDLRPYREKALQYIEGVMDDTPAQKGRSKAMSHDVADTIGWIMPSLMRVFLSSDKVVIYEPMQLNDEDSAEQSTEYINFIFQRRCDGYRHLRSAIYNGLSHGNGVLMHWWDDSVTYQTHSLDGLTQDEFALLVEQEGVEVLAYSERPDPMPQPPPAAGMMDQGGVPGEVQGGPAPAMGLPDEGAGEAFGPDIGHGPPGGGPPPLPPTITPEMEDPTSYAQAGVVMPEQVETQISTGGEGVPLPRDVVGQLPALMAPTLIDCKLRIPIRKGQICIDAVKPEDFFKSTEPVLDERVRFCAVRDRPMRSDLVRWGYDPDLVNDLPASTYSDDPERNAREGYNSNYNSGADSVVDRAAERVEIWECFPLVDYDGDGIAERLRVVMADKAGRHGGNRILEVSEWEDDLPFTDLVPDPVPHRWRGRSIFDETADIQRIKTVLLRSYLDNIYWTNNPQREVVEGGINPVAMDELLNPTFGGVVTVKAAGAVRDLVVPFVADKVLTAMDLMDRVREFRTGISAATQGLDPDVLQNQTATAVNAAQSAARSKVEEYARNIKEVGLPRFFGQLLKLSVKHVDKPEMIRLRDQWVEVNPALWTADMDVKINTGLGTGNRDRDAAAMQGVMSIQEKIIGALGLDNPISGLEEIANAAGAFAESLNIRSHQQYFRDVNADDIRAMQENKQPSPEELKMQAEQQAKQAELQAEQQKLAAEQQARQADQQIRIAEITERAKAEQAKLRLQAESRVAELQYEGQLKREQMQAEERMKREQIRAEYQMKSEQMQAEWAMQQQAMDREHQLKRELALLGARVSVAKADTNISGDANFGGEPG